MLRALSSKPDDVSLENIRLLAARPDHRLPLQQPCTFSHQRRTSLQRTLTLVQHWPGDLFVRTVC